MGPGPSRLRPLNQPLSLFRVTHRRGRLIQNHSPPVVCWKASCWFPPPVDVRPVEVENSPQDRGDGGRFALLP